MRFLVQTCGDACVLEAYRVAFSAAGADVQVESAPDSWDEIAAALNEGGCLGVALYDDAAFDAFETVDITAASAKLSGGANLIVCLKGRTLGFNTVGSAFAEAFERAGVQLSGKRVAIVGTGWQAASCISALAQQGAACVAMLDDDKQRASEVMSRAVEEFGNLSARQMGMPAAKDGQLSFREAYEAASFEYGSLVSADSSLPSASLSAADAVADTLSDARVCLLLGESDSECAPFVLCSADESVRVERIVADAQTVASVFWQEAPFDEDAVRSACASAVQG